MYGVVEVSGHQYKVEAGSIIDVQKIEGEVGKEVKLDNVLFVSGKDHQVGTPFISGANVKAKVLRQDRDRKLRVFKRRPGLWRKSRGHRQCFTSLFITEIDNGSGEVTKASPKSSKEKTAKKKESKKEE